MVTILNQNSSSELWEKYAKLFAKAHADLKKAGVKLSGDRFTSLDEYFAHMGDLLDLNKPVYMLLPLDETPFNINANARTITIPADFAKCGAVKGDNYCEIATFVIDRYFDFKDLAEAKIAVQWVNANKEEGISHIQLIDLESEEGKIRFGWPLVSDITKYPGQVHFAVRFFIEDETTKGKFHYLLNTQTATLNVKDSLNVIDPKHEYENDINEFKRFVSNSANPAYTIPVSPFFTDVNGGKDLPKYAAINNANTLKLEAQAVTSDLGDITYKWFYVPAGSDLKKEIVGGDGIYEVKLYDYVKVDLIVDEKGRVTNSKGLDKYWVKTGSGEAESYELYTGEWPPAANAVLYEIVTSLAFENKDIDIVGEYWVEAVNTIVKNSTNPVSSTHCIVPAPKAIEYTKNLTKHVFIDAKTGEATLSVTIVPDGNNPKIEYHWFSNTEGEKAEYSEIVGVDKNSYDVTEAGWYRVEPKSTLNRKVKTNPSVICKVTKLPEKPVITELAYKLHSASNYNILAEDADMGDRWTLGDLIDLRIKTNLDNEDTKDSLLTEGLHYQWYMQDADTATIHPLTEKDIDDNGLLLAGTKLNSGEITVRCVKDGAAYAYYCVITNEIANVKSEAISSAEYNSFIIK